MTTFESVHESRVVGKLVAVDRLILKGHLNGWMPKGAFARFLLVQGVLLVGFKAYVAHVTNQLKAHALGLAAKASRTYQYLERAHTAARGRSKEDLAREIAERDGIREGLIAVFAAVEPCMSFNVRGNHETHKLEVVRAGRKCLHFYFYIMDREFGFMHVRLQSWFRSASRCTSTGTSGCAARSSDAVSDFSEATTRSFRSTTSTWHSNWRRVLSNANGCASWTRSPDASIPTSGMS